MEEIQALDKGALLDIAKLKRLRKERESTQADIAEKTQISIGYYSEIEAGKKTPSLETTFALAKVFGVTVNDLLLDSGESNPPPPSTPRAATETRASRDSAA